MRVQDPYCVFDLETAPPKAGLSLPCPEHYANKGIQERWKDETKLQHRAENVRAWADELKRLGALDWRLGEMVAAGILVPEAHPDHKPGPQVFVFVRSPGNPANADPSGAMRLDPLPVPEADVKVVGIEDERDLLLVTWSWLARARDVSGFNIREFDIPWLIGRSAIQGVPVGRRFDLSKYRERTGLVDWQERLSFYGAFDFKGWTLAQYAEFFKLRYRPFGEGAEVPDRWHAGDYEWVAKHLAYDLLTEWELHERFAPYFLGDVAA